MKKFATLSGIVFAVSATFPTIQAATIQWADWQNATGYSSYYSSFQEVTGSFSSGITITVTSSPTDRIAYKYPFSEPYTQLNGGINYWAIQDAYTYIPSNEDGIYVNIVPFSITFSSPVQDPVIAVSGFGRTFSSGAHIDGDWIVDTTQVNILSHGMGLSGSEYTPLHIDPSQQNRIIGDNGNGIIQFHGTFTDINIVSSSATTFFTVGITAVPVPAAIWLFGSGLIALIGTTHRRI